MAIKNDIDKIYRPDIVLKGDCKVLIANQVLLEIVKNEIVDEKVDLIFNSVD